MVDKKTPIKGSYSVKIISLDRVGEKEFPFGIFNDDCVTVLPRRRLPFFLFLSFSSRVFFLPIESWIEKDTAKEERKREG